MGGWVAGGSEHGEEGVDWQVAVELVAAGAGGGADLPPACICKVCGGRGEVQLCATPCNSPGWPCCQEPELPPRAPLHLFFAFSSSTLRS